MGEILLRKTTPDTASCKQLVASGIQAWNGEKVSMRQAFLQIPQGTMTVQKPPNKPAQNSRFWSVQQTTYLKVFTVVNPYQLKQILQRLTPV